MADRTYDGLIPEDSVNVFGTEATPVANWVHSNAYHEYPQINHTNLIEDQAIAQIIIEWATQLPP